MTLSWDPPLGSVSYLVRVRDETDGTLRDSRNNCPGATIYLCVDGWASTTITISVSAGHSYAWWVHATDGSGVSGDPASSWFSVQGTQTAGPRWVGPVVFNWFGPKTTPGQWQSPWLPLEGRDAWDGSVAFWRKQERDMIDAGFNFIIFQIPHGWEWEMRNHLLANRALLAEGQWAPMIAPNFEAASWPCYECLKDFQTPWGKDAAYQIFKEWFDLYFSILDEDRLVRVLGKVLLILWYVPGCESAPGDFLTYINDRLQADFGFTPYWSTHACWAPIGPDEVHYLFNGYDRFQYGSRRNVDLLVGAWPPNAGYGVSSFLARDGGRTFEAAWSDVLASEDLVDRVYVESWNEYSEGSGMFEARPESHWPGDGHLTTDDLDLCWDAPCHPLEYTDTWGPDPRLYIRINALHAAHFLNRVNDATFVAQEVSTTMEPGKAYDVSITIRNNGTSTWSPTTFFRLGSQGPQDNMKWGLSRVELDPGELLAPGMSREFRFSVLAPSIPGTYTFQWRMLQEEVGWFGEATPDVTVSVESPPPVPEPLPGPPWLLIIGVAAFSVALVVLTVLYVKRRRRDAGRT